MRWWAAQFFQAAEASQPGGIADQFAQTPVIGMLIFNQTRGKHCAWTNASDNCRQLSCVSGAKFQMRITVKFDEFNCCT